MGSDIYKAMCQSFVLEHASLDKNIKSGIERRIRGKKYARTQAIPKPIISHCSCRKLQSAAAKRITVSRCRRCCPCTSDSDGILFGHLGEALVKATSGQEMPTGRGKQQGEVLKMFKERSSHGNSTTHVVPIVAAVRRLLL